MTTIPKRIQLALDGLGLKANGGYFTKDNNSELFTAWWQGKVVTTLMYDSDTKTWVPYQRKPWRPKVASPQIYSLARRFRLESFVYDEATIRDEYLDSLGEFLEVMSWAANEFDKYGPDGPSGTEIAQKLRDNQAAKMIVRRNHIPLTGIWELVMDDMNPDTMLNGLGVIRQNLAKARPSN